MAKRNNYRPRLEELESRLVPTNLWWYPVSLPGGGLSTDMADPHNYWNLDQGGRNNANSFSTTDALTFKSPLLQGLGPWNSDGTFGTSVDVGSIQVQSSWCCINNHTMSLGDGVAITTHTASTIDGWYDAARCATISMAGTASLTLVGGDWGFNSDFHSGTILGGTLLCPAGTLTITPPTGRSVGASTYIHVNGGTVRYTTGGNLDLQNNGKIQVDTSGVFYASDSPVLRHDNGQNITAASNSNSITVKDGVFETSENGMKLTVGIPIAVADVLGTLQVDSGTDLVVASGVSASAGVILMQAGSAANTTTIDTGTTGLSLTGTGTLKTVNNSGSNHWCQINGSLTTTAGTTVWIGANLDGTAGGELFVNGGSVDISGTLKVSVWVSLDPQTPPPFYASQLLCNSNVTFEAGASLVIDQPNGPLALGSSFIVVDTSIGSGTTNKPADPTGFTLSLNAPTPNRLTVTKN